jgi:hypothetical protein
MDRVPLIRGGKSARKHGPCMQGMQRQYLLPEWDQYLDPPQKSRPPNR